MTETLHAGRRRGREARLLTAGVLACGAVLLPAASAMAEDMPAMKDGMMCPHAVGDLSNPATTAPPTRSAPNEAPLAARPSSVVTQPSPGRAATRPASKPSAQRAGATRPATTTANAKAGAGAVVKVTQPQRAVTPVAQPQRAVSPVAQRPTVQAASKPAASSPARAQPKHSAAARVQTPRVGTTVIPEVTRPSAGNAPRITSISADTPNIVGWLALGGVLVLVASAALVLRRRGSAGAAVIATTNDPLEPVVWAETATFDEVEVALQELLAEARARELLVDADAGEAPEPVVAR